MSDYTTKYIQLSSIFKYFAQGGRMAFSPELRKFIVVPIIANIALIFLAVILFFLVVSNWLSSLLLGLGNYAIFGFISYILSCLLSFFIIFIMVYYFATLAIILAAPFYGFLAQKIEAIRTGQPLPDEAFSQVVADLPRIFRRELDKQCFFIPWALLCLIITIIPAINIISPLMWIALTSFMGAIQFCDYGFDNHKISFKEMKLTLAENKVCTLTFGFIVVVGMTIPVLNLIMPVIAVCAATLYFLDMNQRINPVFPRVEHDEGAGPDAGQIENNGQKRG